MDMSKSQRHTCLGAGHGVNQANGGQADSYLQIMFSPENYKMIAVSGTLYRLYSNLLCSIVRDSRHTVWFLSRQEHATTIFYPATPQRCSSEDAEGFITPVRTLRSLTSNKRKIRFLETSCGIT